MLGECLEIGDVVIVKIEKESREWGYNPCPDGTKAKVIGFSEIAYGRTHNFGHKPGIYENRSWITIQSDDDKQWSEYAGRLELADTTLAEKRLIEFRAKQVNSTWRDRAKFIRELPFADFWEEDTVKFRQGDRPLPLHILERKDGKVFKIDYLSLYTLTDINTFWPAFDITCESGGTTGFNQTELTLVSRGNVWKYYHDESLDFSDLKEEAAFFQMLGHTEEVRNPKSKLYVWSKDEVLKAIKEGIVDGFTMQQTLFGPFDALPNIRAIKFKNEELGRRVAKATLEGFSLAA